MANPPEKATNYTLIITAFLNAGLSAVGKKYVWGGNNLNLGVDCSGLVSQAMAAAGYKVPRTAAELGRYALPLGTDMKVARAGDLVFWDRTSSKDRVPGADHVGIYLGGGMVLEASSGQKRVVIRKLWGSYRFGRIIGAKPGGTPQKVKLGDSGYKWSAGTGVVGPASQGNKTVVSPAPLDGFENSTDPYGAAAAFLDGAPPHLRSGASEQEIVDFILENYGMAARAFLSIPELRKALIDAAKAGAVGDRGLEYVYKTKWWQQRTEAQRAWDVLWKADPAEAKDRLAKRKAALSGLWETFGVDESMDLVAWDFERLGLNEQQLNIRIAESLKKESERTGLDRGTQGAVEADDLMRIARQDYLTQISRNDAEKWIIKAIRTGTDVEEQFRNYMASVSSQRFGVDPTSGVTPGDVLAPVRNVIAENLEINPEAIDLLDPQYNEVLQTETKDGTFRPMTAAEAMKWARSQEKFKGTAKAEEVTSNLAEMLAKTFGKVG